MVKIKNVPDMSIALMDIKADVRREIKNFTGPHNVDRSLEQLEQLIIHVCGKGVLSYGYRIDRNVGCGAILLVCYKTSNKFKIVRINSSGGIWTSHDDTEWTDLREVMDYIMGNWI